MLYRLTFQCELTEKVEGPEATIGVGRGERVSPPGGGVPPIPIGLVFRQFFLNFPVKIAGFNVHFIMQKNYLWPETVTRGIIDL